MAKPTGPLLSVSARGTVGKVLTFGSRLGVNTVRMWVIPKNLKSNDQAEVRTKLAIPGKGAKVCGRGVTSDCTVIEQMRMLVSAGQTWNSQISKEELGTNLANYDADKVLYTALDPTHKGYWSAGAATVGLVDFELNYGAYGIVTAGEILFHLAMALYRSGAAIITKAPNSFLAADVTDLTDGMTDNV